MRATLNGNKPPYSIDSVDNALRILQTLRDSGQVRVSDVAAELGIARSTAHRLLAMLVYRDFAVQADEGSDGEITFGGLRSGLGSTA